MTRALITAVFVVALVPVAIAQPRDTKRAVELFEEGRVLMGQKKYEEACKKFADSYLLDPALGTKLNHADCYEKRGMFEDAHRLFDEAEAEARASKLDPQEKFARDHRVAVEAQLAKVTIAIAPPQAMAIAKIKIGSGNASASTKPRFVAPGRIVVVVEATGYKPSEQTVDGVAGKETKVTVALEADATSGGGGGGGGAGGLGGGGDGGGGGGDIGPVDEKKARPSRVPAYAVFGVSGGLIVGSLVLGGLARSLKNDAVECAENMIEPLDACNATMDKAGSRADVATVVFAGGVVGAAVGTWLWLRVRRQERAASTPALAPTMTSTAVGVVYTTPF
jgi:hypothetical protein